MRTQDFLPLPYSFLFLFAARLNLLEKKESFEEQEMSLNFRVELGELLIRRIAASVKFIVPLTF